MQKCRKCGEVFVPSEYERLDKHFHGLKSWASFQHVAYGTSFGVLEEMLREFFDLCVHDPEVHMFKSLLAHYYKPTRHSPLKKILSGSVMHIDDTEVKLKTGRGYVTVITSLEEVVFIYRPTKEGGFVQDLLKNFHGVLVSDCHPTYDSVPCPQQKCLIHLMQDINQDLLNSPFDQELQAITRPFGTLLRSVVETVDQYGLKRRYLKRHAVDVARFFEFVATLSVQSDSAKRLQERFMKCQDKLFTFIKYDGVPWNNNNAENAIKRFAYYREDTAGTMRGGAERLPPPAEYLPDLPVQGHQLPKVSVVEGGRLGRFLRTARQETANLTCGDLSKGLYTSPSLPLTEVEGYEGQITTYIG